MSVELQLRALAEAATAEQRPVTAIEAMARSADSMVDQRPRRNGWLLVAATVALVGGGLVALAAAQRTPNIEPVPGGSIPETVPPEPTAPDGSTPATEPATIPVPRGQSNEGFVNEPTLGYRDGAQWWVPGVQPAGWRYGYAVDDGSVQAIRLLGPDQSTIDVEFGGDAASIDDVAADSSAEDLGGDTWNIAGSGGGVGVAARVVDGRLLVVRGPIEAVRVVGASLELLPETELVRPPFRSDAEPGPVVLTLPAGEFGLVEPFELRAHTDGLFTTVGGEIKQLSSDDPVAFGDDIYDVTGDDNSYPVVMTGVAFGGVEQVTFGLLDGNSVDVATTESDRFAERFYAFVTEVPTTVLERHQPGGSERLTRWTTATVDGEQRSYGLDPAGTTPLRFEPTTTIGDEEWLVPIEVPDGREFQGSARRYQSGSNWIAQEVSYVD